MAQLGADPTRLRSVAARFERAADELDLILRRTSGRLGPGSWSGPDAEAFSRRWRSTASPALRASASTCRSCARALRDQARHQIEASDASGGPGAPPGPPATPSGRGGGTLDLAPPPLRTEQVRLAAGGHVALLGGRGELVLRIEQLTDGRLGVTTEESLHGGLVGRAPTPASGSHLEATAGGVRRREWNLDTTELPGLVAGLAVESSPLGVVPRALDSAADLADGALGLVGIRTDLDRWSAVPGLPPTAAVEHLAVVGTAGAVGLGPLRLGSEGSVAVGRRSDASGDRPVLEWSESVTARSRAPWSTSLARSLGVDWAPEAEATVEGRIELPDSTASTDDDRSIRIRITSTVGSDRTVVDAVVGADHIDPRAAGLEAAATALATGDTGAAAQVLTGTALGDAVAWRITGYRVEEHRAALPASVGLAGLTPDGSWERSSRR